MNTLARGFLALACLTAALAALSRPPQRASRTAHEAPMLPRKEALRVIGAAHIQLVADYFWIQTLQVTGRALTKEDFRDIFDYADMVTDLDGRFREIYVFAGAAIPFQVKRDVWVNTQESTRILEKGIKAAPDHILLRILLAYNYSAFHGEYQRAAALIAQTSKMKGAPKYLAALATRLYARAGEFDAGYELARSLYEEATDEETKQTFGMRLKQLDLERELTQVDRAVQRFEKREGRRPPDVQALLSAGDLTSQPVDPFGGQILLDSNGEARSSVHEERLRLHQPSDGAR